MSRPVISMPFETKQTPGSQTTWSRFPCEESCHLLPTEGWYRLLFAVIQALVPRWDKCLNSNREYVEVWCVLCATHVLYVHQFQNKLLGFSVFVSRQGTFRIWGWESLIYWGTLFLRVRTDVFETDVIHSITIWNAGLFKCLRFGSSACKCGNELLVTIKVKSTASLWMEFQAMDLVVSVVIAENYGQSGIQAFRELAEKANVCIAKEDSVLSNAEEEVFDRVLRKLDEDKNARVVVCFCEGLTIRGLLAATKRLKLTGRFLFLGRYKVYWCGSLTLRSVMSGLC